MLTPGCALFKHPPKPPRAEVVGIPSFVGTVAVVDEDDRFVLIDTDYTSTLEPGTELKTLTGQTETGTLRLSPEKRRPFFAADIVSGAPKKGDRVLQIIRKTVPRQ